MRIILMPWLLVLLASNSTMAAKEPKPEFLMQTVTAALNWMSNVEKFYHEHQVEPEARQQAIRKLQKLSTALSDLRTHKEDLTEALKKAELPRDLPLLARQITEYEQTIWRLRHNLHEYVQVLPPDLQTSGNELENELSKNLLEKADSLDRIAKELNGSNTFDRDEVVKNGKKTIEIVSALKTKVDGLIQSLATTQKTEE